MGLITDQAGALAKAVTDDTKSCSMPGQLGPRGVTMRDCLMNRAGVDRVLMAVAATFLTVSAPSAIAQGYQARNSAAELAIDAAIPRPEPANVPPPTINDFKLDSATPAPDGAKVEAPKTTEQAPETNPSTVVTAPPADTNKADANKNDTATTAPAPAAATAAAPASVTPPAAAPAAEPAREPVKAASNVPPADQPVADKLRDILGAKTLRYFDRKAERAA